MKASRIKLSKASLFLKVKDDKIYVESNECQTITNVRWQVKDRNDWLLLKTKDHSIDFVHAAIFVEAFCGEELMMAADDFRLVKDPSNVNRIAALSREDRLLLDDLVPVAQIEQNWDFTKLPDSLHAKAIDAYESNDAAYLKWLHDTYKLSPNTYCCGWDVVMKNHFKDAITRGEITR